MASRSLDHLRYDENLYDVMRSMIPFNIYSGNSSVSRLLLGQEGLARESQLAIYYNDNVSKRELINDLILSAILPQEWKEISIERGQGLAVVYLDLFGQFQARKMLEKVRQTYDQLGLFQPGHYSSEKEKEQAELEDKNKFIKDVMSNVFVYQCMNAQELTFAVRSLPALFRRRKNVGLVVLDGLQFVDCDTSGQDIRSGSGRQHKGPNLDDIVGDDVLDASNFMTSANTRKSPQQKPVERPLFAQTRYTKPNQKPEPRVFESKLLERCVNLLVEMQRGTQFSLIKTHSRLIQKKSTDLPGEIMAGGIDKDCKPKRLDANEADGAGKVIEGHIRIEDEHLKDVMRMLRPGEALLLKRGKAGCLAPADVAAMNGELLTASLSCIVLPDPKGEVVLAESDIIPPKKFYAVFLLYTNEKDRYRVQDDVVKAFYL